MAQSPVENAVDHDDGSLAGATFQFLVLEDLHLVGT
jgi:hypothetical protein